MTRLESFRIRRFPRIGSHSRGQTRFSELSASANRVTNPTRFQTHIDDSGRVSGGYFAGFSEFSHGRGRRGRT